MSLLPSQKQGILLNQIKKELAMWSLLVDRLTDVTTLVCTILSFAIPFTVYQINRTFHKNTNPPWKRRRDT